MEFDVVTAREIKAGDRVKSWGDFEEVTRVYKDQTRPGHTDVVMYFLDGSRSTIRATDLVTRMREAL